MKNFIKVIILNFVILFCSFLVVDYVYFKHIYMCYINSIENEEYRQEEKDANIRYKAFDLFTNDNQTTNVYNVFLEKGYYHDVIFPMNSTHLDPPIILFGDSYTWLYNDKGLQKLLAEYTSRPVFNFAFWGWGTQHMYYLSQKELLYKIIDDKLSRSVKIKSKVPEYAVYTYIRDHRNRLCPVMDYFLNISPYLNYQNKNNKPEIKKYSFLHRLMFRSFIYRYFLFKHKNYDNKFAYDMIYNLIIETRKELQKHYPDIKFILFEYYQNKDYIREETDLFNKLKEDGIIIISTKDLTNEDLLNSKYTDPDGYHPNPSAWKLLVPLFVKAVKYQALPDKI